MRFRTMIRRLIQVQQVMQFGEHERRTGCLPIDTVFSRPDKKAQTHTYKSHTRSTHSKGNTWEGELCGEKACGGEREICTGSEKDFSEST
jgi:hypothetical protein